MTNEEISKNLIIRYNEILKDTSSYDVFVRDITFQIDQVKKLKKFLLEVKYYKNHLIKDYPKLEQLINLLFHFQCVLNAHINSLAVWINLKKGKNYEAWTNLVEAQKYILYALKTSHEESYGLEEFQLRLKAREEALFPKFHYVSSGLVMRGGVCSICNDLPEKCEHIEDEVYLGRVCKRVKQELIGVNHLAYVDYPEDKGCIFTKIEDKNGNMRDVFTYKIVKKKKPSDTETIQSSIQVETCMLRQQNLDIF